LKFPTKLKIQDSMKEKILALLLAKFAGVRKDGLSQLATSLALTVATEEEATAIVDKLTADSVNAYIGDIRKDIDSEISKANKTYEDGLKKKFDFVEKKKDDPKPPTPPPDPNDMATIIANAVKQAVEPLHQKIEGIEKAKTIEQVVNTAKAKLKEKGIPESFVGAISLDSEDKIDEFVTQQEQRFSAFKQEQINAGVWTDKPAPGAGKTKADDENFGKSLAEKANKTANTGLEGKKLE